MEMISDLQAMGLRLDTSAHAGSGETGSPDRALTLMHVKCDDLDLSSLDGVQELQDRLEQAIAEARWASAGLTNALVPQRRKEQGACFPSASDPRGGREGAGAPFSPASFFADDLTGAAETKDNS